MARFLRLTRASGQAVFVNPAHISLFEPYAKYHEYTQKHIPEVKTRLFISGSNSSEYSEYPEEICVRETALQIAKMLDGEKDVLDD